MGLFPPNSLARLSIFILSKARPKYPHITLLFFLPGFPDVDSPAVSALEFLAIRGRHPGSQQLRMERRSEMSFLTR